MYTLGCDTHANLRSFMLDEAPFLCLPPYPAVPNSVFVWRLEHRLEVSRLLIWHTPPSLLQL